ncbi:hypothetical protein BJ741DRAFT_549668 [Chytriomyces cf. hyalinus JEL632]|nr:hypothetical protein BJ741DRAFT_549668 [Chytriomyces cf. hyalinus JEL632]
MSWFGSSGSAARKDKSNADTFAFSDEFNDELDNIGAGSDVENDAALLAELEGLKSEMGLNVKPKPKPKPTTAPAPPTAANTFNMTPDASGHVEITLPEVDSHEEDVHVDFSEADMNDPDLLRELAAVTGGSETMLAGEVRVEVHAVRTSIPIVASAFAAATDDDDELAALRADMNMGSGSAPTPRRASNEDILSLAQRLKCTDPATVAKYISLEKLRLANAKTLGDSAAGSESQNAIKALETHYDELIADQNVGPKSPVSNEVPAQPLASSITLIEVKRRQLEYKQAALAFKQRGDAPKARELLVVSKTMQDTIDIADANGIIPFEYRIPGPPPAPPAPVAVAKPIPTKPVAASAPATPAVKPSSAVATATVSTSKPVTTPSTPVISATTTPSLPANTKELLTRLHTQLESQIALCTSIAGTYFKAGNKPAALEYHKRKKTYQNDIEVLSSVVASFDGSVAAASAIYFHYEEIRYEVEQTHADVSNEEMDVLVERAFDLTLKGVPEVDLAAYIAFDIGWPVDGGDGKGLSGTIGKTASPEFNYSKRIKIDRNRPFQRHLERKRAVFDVYHLAKGFGGISMFSKPVQIGRASVPLNTLLNKCEIHEVVDIMDVVNPRKSTGGKLEVKLRLRVPLAKRDITVKQERWVALSLGGPATVQTTTDMNQTVSAPAVVVEIPQALASPAVVMPVVPPAAGIVTPPAAGVASPPTGTTPRPTTPSAAAPAATSGATPVPAPTAQDVDEVELEFLNPDNIASNMVLENEHGAILAQISALKVSKKPIPDDLVDRKNGYEIRMNMLVTLVQLGTLTMPAYIANVKSSIAVTKKHALLFKTNNKIELAKQAMVRIKAMTEEVAEVEQAIANGEL